MQLSELVPLIRDLETASLERALRLLSRAFLAEEAGLLSLNADRNPLVYMRNLGPDAKEPTLDEAKGALIESPVGEMQTLRLHPYWRGIVIAVTTDNRAMFWLRKMSAWTKSEEQAFQTAAYYLARSCELRERLASNREGARLDERLGDAAQFSGRIAHDFDNILTGVTGFADLSTSMVPSDSQLGEFLREILAAGQRGLVFTQQLHHLSRSGIVKAIPTAMDAVLQKEKLRQPGILLDLPDGLPEVALEASSLQLVLAYLIDNALEASPRDGKVSVACRLVELSSAERSDYLGQPVPGPYVQVSISDEGPGIREDIRPRLFHEPFVTTKARHRGLGLPICYRILRVHRAGIRLESRSGRGTTAQVVVPLAAARKRNTPAATREIAHSSGGLSS